MSREQARNPKMWDNINSLLRSNSLHESDHLTDQIIALIELIEEEAVITGESIQEHIPEECPNARCPICICVANYVFRRDVKSL